MKLELVIGVALTMVLSMVGYTIYDGYPRVLFDKGDCIIKHVNNSEFKILVDVDHILKVKAVGDRELLLVDLDGYLYSRTHFEAKYYEEIECPEGL